jgi:hypothetical protein
VTRRMLVAVLATAVLVLALAAAAPRPAEAGVSFVDKQVEAGGLLLQNYVNIYGMTHGFAFPAVTMVKKGGGLEDATRIWPSNPWTGRLMGPGTSRGTYTYTLRNGGTAYSLAMHLSRGKYVFTGTMPVWLKQERDTAATQNGWLLRRYLDVYAAAHGGVYPAPADVTPAVFAGYSWPTNPWTGVAMAQSATLGDFAYTGGGASYTLKVKLTTGWTSVPVSLIGKLTTAPGG